MRARRQHRRDDAHERLAARVLEDLLAQLLAAHRLVGDHEDAVALVVGARPAGANIAQRLLVGVARGELPAHGAHRDADQQRHADQRVGQGADRDDRGDDRHQAEGQAERVGLGFHRDAHGAPESKAARSLL